MRSKVNITIPTYNRDYCLEKAIKGALSQSYDHTTVTVIDDGSSDESYKVAQIFFEIPNFCYVKLDKNVGTAQAKNFSLLCSDYDAITFHDSDDQPNEHKILMQVRALNMAGHQADPILNWDTMGKQNGRQMRVDIVVGAHKMIKLDGSIHVMNKRISLVDDFFPTLQFPSKTEGDWILINSGLFRKNVFTEVGGFLDSVEEDRELRNRTIGCGYLYYFLEEPLLTKIEMDDSLTVSEDTNYIATRRIKDREEAWRRNKFFMQNDDKNDLIKKVRIEIDLSQIKINFISNPSLLTFNEQIPCTEATAELFYPFKQQKADKTYKS
ncbi:MAG: glycosyltransferase family 2 protein [Balneolales bacterium]